MKIAVIRVECKGGLAALGRRSVGALREMCFESHYATYVLLTSVPLQIGYNLAKVSVEQRPKQFQFDLSGGHLALDFANSISRRDDPEKTVEHLNAFQDLISFARQTGVLSSDQAQTLERNTQSHLRAAGKALLEAIAFREATFRVFLSVANEKPASQQDVGVLDEATREALRHRRIVRENGRYLWRWDNDLAVGKILWSIAESAAALLTSPEVKMVRECEASDCYWLFLDNSRNHSRRWCTMSACGNREKARRHYQRQRGT